MSRAGFSPPLNAPGAFSPPQAFHAGQTSALGSRAWPYFVTVRCADSLPREVIKLLQEVGAKLNSIEPKSEAFAELQRFYFRTLEMHLDEGRGSCPLRNQSAASLLLEEFNMLREWQVDVPHYVVMPNHWHPMVEPRESCTRSLPEIMRRVKGRSARAINRSVGPAGALWQREWFDRWMRDDAEYDRCVQYIQNNPAKAGVPQQDRWTR